VQRTPSILALVAGLLGAAGVALAAVAAHRVQDAALATASQMLLVHATAALALASIAGQSARARLWTIAASLLLIGVTLFAGDIAARAFLGDRLFPMAAPTGGSTMILGWLTAAVAAALSLRRDRQ
jgi:uncharacterized membrane protein YgdD (TMEM256/DUF423 family)